MAVAEVLHEEMGLRLPTLAFETGVVGQVAVAVLDLPRQRLVRVRQRAAAIASADPSDSPHPQAAEAAAHTLTQIRLVDGPGVCIARGMADGSGRLTYLDFGTPVAVPSPDALVAPPSVQWGEADRLLCSLPTEAGLPPSLVVARKPLDRATTIELLLFPPGSSSPPLNEVLLRGGVADTVTCAHACLAPPTTSTRGEAKGRVRGTSGAYTPHLRGGSGADTPDFERGFSSATLSVHGTLGRRRVWLWIGSVGGGLHRFVIPDAILATAVMPKGVAAVSATMVSEASGLGTRGDMRQSASGWAAASSFMEMEASLLLPNAPQRVETLRTSCEPEPMLAVEFDSGKTAGNGMGAIGSQSRSRGGKVATAYEADRTVHLLSLSGEVLFSAERVSVWGVSDVAKWAHSQLLLWRMIWSTDLRAALAVSKPGIAPVGGLNGEPLSVGCALLTAAHAWIEAEHLSPVVGCSSARPQRRTSSMTSLTGTPGGEKDNTSTTGGDAGNAIVTSASATRLLRMYSIARGMVQRARGGQEEVHKATQALESRQVLRSYALHCLKSAADTYRPSKKIGLGGSEPEHADGCGIGDTARMSEAELKPTVERRKLLESWRAAEGLQSIHSPAVPDTGGPIRPKQPPSFKPPDDETAGARQAALGDVVGAQALQKGSKLQLVSLRHGFDMGEWVLSLGVRNMETHTYALVCAALTHMQVSLDTRSTAIAQLLPSADAVLVLRLSVESLARLATSATAAFGHADVILCWSNCPEAVRSGSPPWERRVATRIRLDLRALAHASFAVSPAVLSMASYLGVPQPKRTSIFASSLGHAMSSEQSALAPFDSRPPCREVSLLLRLDRSTTPHEIRRRLGVAIGAVPCVASPAVHLAMGTRLGPLHRPRDELRTADGSISLCVHTGGGMGLGVGVDGGDVELSLRSTFGASDAALPLAAAALTSEFPQVVCSGASPHRLQAVRAAIQALAFEVSRTLALVERPMHSLSSSELPRSVALWQRETDEEMAQLHALLEVDAK